MQLWVSEENLPFFEALASPVRIKIIKRLAEGKANIKQLAESVGVTSAMMTSHINKLERVGLVVSTRSKQYGKVCSLRSQWYVLSMPTVNHTHVQNYEVQIGVGQYTRANVKPTCGIADTEKVIGGYDDPRYFYDPAHYYAQLVWFTSGYLEYEIPNYIPEKCKILDIEISAEMCSEYPSARMDWESDINLYLNNKLICPWVSPGDFGDKKGKYTPVWWTSAQYGILKRFEINRHGVFLDKEQKSNFTVDDDDLDRDHWTLRFEVSEEKRRPGGLTIFGEKFGDHPRAIQVKINYEKSALSEEEKKENLFEKQSYYHWEKYNGTDTP